MNKPLYDFFTRDHRRIEKLLDKATEDINAIQMDYYQRFRTGLLTHIKMEENVLFPAAKKVNNNVHLPIIPQFRLEHGALTSLMVPPPTPSLIKVLRHILEQHDIAEEKPGGLYEVCESLAQAETDTLLERLGNTAEVPVHPHNSSDFALGATKRAVERAGYDYDELAN